jgi:hypothetical protein
MKNDSDPHETEGVEAAVLSRKLFLGLRVRTRATTPSLPSLPSVRFPRQKNPKQKITKKTKISQVSRTGIDPLRLEPLPQSPC